MIFDFEVNSGSSTHSVDKDAISDASWKLGTDLATLPTGSGYPAQQLAVRYAEVLELLTQRLPDHGDGRAIREFATVVRKMALHHGSIVVMSPQG